MAILTPSAVLCVVGLRMAQQERELESKRLAEDRQATLVSFREHLGMRLESARSLAAARWREFQSAPYEEIADPELALVAVVESSRWLMPWECSRLEERVSHALFTGDFASVMAKAERGEAGFQEALALAQSPPQKGYARLSLAAAYRKAGSMDQARREYELLLKDSAVDEHGVPFALYAAIALRRAPTYAGCATPECAHLFQRTLMEMHEPVPDGLHALTQWIDRVENLRKELPIIPSPDHWLAAGDPPWLISNVVQKEAPSLLVAVRCDRLIPAPVKLARAGGEPLGDRFGGLRIQLPVKTVDDGPARTTYVQASFGLVILAALFSAWLLWRDLRREEQLARTRSQFVASVSHELRTPLTAIRLFAETLRLRPDAPSARRESCLDTIIGESERLSRLVDNVLDFSRIEQGHRTYHLAAVDLNTLLEAAVAPLRFILDQSGFELRTQLSSEAVRVNADADAIQQAALNMLTNAMKYSRTSRTIGLRLYREGSEAVIEVQDQGIGIDEKDQRRIFESFYRVECEGTRVVPGAGLGLTLVAHIAKGHQGRVTVNSRPGAGSTFALRLPLQEGA